MQALQPVAVRRGWIAAGAALKFKRLPWGLMRVGALLMPAWAGLLEMRYLWNTPHRLSNDRLTALIGAEPHTDLAIAANAALEDLGLLTPSNPDLRFAPQKMLKPFDIMHRHGTPAHGDQADVG